MGLLGTSDLSLPVCLYYCKPASLWLWLEQTSTLPCFFSLSASLKCVARDDVFLCLFWGDCLLSKLRDNCTEERCFSQTQTVVGKWVNIETMPGKQISVREERMYFSSRLVSRWHLKPLALFCLTMTNTSLPINSPHHFKWTVLFRNTKLLQERQELNISVSWISWALGMYSLTYTQSGPVLLHPWIHPLCHPPPTVSQYFFSPISTKKKTLLHLSKHYLLLIFLCFFLWPHVYPRLHPFTLRHTAVSLVNVLAWVITLLPQVCRSKLDLTILTIRKLLIGLKKKKVQPYDDNRALCGERKRNCNEF